MWLERMTLRIAVIAGLALALAAPAGAQQPSHARGRGSVSYAPPTAEGAPGPSGYVDLSQDGESGAGFYPLPKPDRSEARHQRAVQYRGERNAIGTAIASEAIPYDFDEGYVFGNSHGVFNPVDGAGTPFFGGYYD